MNIVRYKRSEIPPATEEELAKLRALDEKITSGEIKVDCSDIPEIDENWLEGTIVGRFYRPIKKQTSIRIDADVLDYFRSRGKGYQKHLNKVLREVMIREKSASTS